MTAIDPMARFDHIACETVHYGAWDTGTRTMYATAIPLWEETMRSGHPLLGTQETRWTAFPPQLPARLPPGATSMGVDVNEDDRPFNYVVFEDELAAFTFCTMEAPQ